MKFNSLIPELSVTDIEKSKKFYELIGFKIKYERKEDKFAFLELDDNQIMIEEINDHWNVGELKYPFGNGMNLSITVKDVKGLYDKLLKNDIKIFRKLRVDKYLVGDEYSFDEEFLVQDPDGYLLRFVNE